jgi:prevent-host-death family protein
MSTSVTSTAEKDWSVAVAKSRFSEVVERALSSGPQTITRRGRRTAVVLSADEWDRKTRQYGNLADFFQASPLPSSELRLERNTEAAGGTDL